MAHIASRTVRIGCFALLAAILAAGNGGNAIAKAGKGRVPARSAVSEGLMPQQQVRLGPMRYYGGPKSPMWRGPAEN